MATFFERVGSAVSNIFSGSGNSPSEVTIQPGDTLSKIAANNNTTVDAIAKANNITDVDKIYAGNTLTIPGTTSSRSAPATSRDTGRDDNSSSVSSTANTSNTPAPAVDDSSTDNVTAAADRFTQILEAAGLEVSSANIAAIASDPQKFMTERGLNLSSYLNDLQIDPKELGTTLDPNDPAYALTYGSSYQPETVEATTITAPTAEAIPTIKTADASSAVAGPSTTVNAVTGEITDANLVDPESYVIDAQGAATGINKDGTTNFTGQALNNYATVNISNVIDTSTTAGKLLAAKLGEGNYLDAKATLLGQMEILSAEFKDANGNPTIPSWAAGTYRSLQRTMAFKGVTGTAALAASVNALMEASLPIAQADSEFYQSLTIKNLDNRQESILNKANVLAKFDIANLSAREAAAVENARAFLQIDLENLSNEQQAEVINKQNRVDALFTATAEENVNRRLNVQNEIETTRFYDQLKYNAAEFNANATNTVRMFNAGEANAATEFSLKMEADRQQFESTMAFNIDKSNAAWRQTVSLTNSKMAFDAAAADVRSALDISTEALNRLWDRVDSQLDFIWRSTEADEQRDYELLLAELQAQGQGAAARGQSSGSIISALITGLFSLSDIRLKDDIRLFDTMPNGVKIYTWAWNEEAKRIGADSIPGFGVIAQEIQETHPDAVMVGDDGYLRVNYRKVLQ